MRAGRCLQNTGRFAKASHIGANPMFKAAQTHITLASVASSPIDAPLSAETPRRRRQSRVGMKAETRSACLTLGVVWLRANGPQKFGRKLLADLTAGQLAEVHTAAVAAVAAL